MAQFERYIGIDYSGAETAESSCRGLRIYLAEGSGAPEQVQPPRSSKWYWTRRGLAEWLCNRLGEAPPALVGIDHGFSFPMAYFDRYQIPRNWQSFLGDFHRHWPTDQPGTFIDLIRDGGCGDGANRMGESNWLRLTERWTATAKSVFLFDVQGSVAKATFAGLPWLLYIRKHCRRPLHFWPFDGWDIPTGKSVVAEVYPALWVRRFPRDNRDGDEQAAYAAAAWMQRLDRNEGLATFLNPRLTEREREIADIEGWILGVT